MFILNSGYLAGRNVFINHEMHVPKDTLENILNGVHNLPFPKIIWHVREEGLYFKQCLHSLRFYI